MRYLIILLVCLSILFAPNAFGAEEKEDLSKIRKTVKDTSYGNYWKRLDDINKLGKMQTKESTELLIELLTDKEPPIIEAVVMALAKMKDKPLIKWFVEQTIGPAQSNPAVKANACWALSFIKFEEATQPLVKALADNDPRVSIKVMEAMAPLAPANSYSDVVAKKLSHSDAEVRYVAARTIAVMKSPKVFDTLVKKMNESNAEVRAALIAAIAVVEKPDKSLPRLVRALKDTAPEVKISAVESLFGIDEEQAIKLLPELINDRDWPVRASVIHALSKIRKKESVHPLITRLPKETGRLRYDIVQALKNLTGQSLGYDAKNWETWYKANEENIEVKKEPSRIADDPNQFATIAVSRFFEIPIFGENIVFIIDFSGSMKTEDKEAGKRRIDIARAQLAEALKKFTPKMKFNIILMSTEATKIKKRRVTPGLLPATDQNKQKGLDFVNEAWDKLEDIRRGRGDMYDALMEAFAEKEVDTVFIISDGNPTYGQFVVPENILQNLIRHNCFRKIMINTIVTGGNQTGERLMRNIAGQSGGVCLKK